MGLGPRHRLVQGSDIVVSVAGFYAVYYKPTNEPQLKLRRRTDHALLARGIGFAAIASSAAIASGSGKRVQPDGSIGGTG